MRSLFRQNNQRGVRRAGRTSFVVLSGIALLLALNALAVQPAGEDAADDAIFVEAGRVGIGKKPDPSSLLDVGGNAGIKGQLLVGNPTMKSEKEGTGQLKITTTFTGFPNFNSNAEISNDISTDFGKALMLTGNASRNMATGERWVQVWDSLEVTKDLTVRGQGKIGDLTVNRNAVIDKDLTVKGTITGNVNVTGTINGNVTGTITGNVAGTINGELSPITFELGRKDRTTQWSTYLVPGSIIRDYLGDADGGTIKILVHNHNKGARDEVRVITETVYFEQPDSSSNDAPGLYGSTKQLGGGDQSFILNTAEKFDIIPKPWGWVYVRNYGTGRTDRANGLDRAYSSTFPLGREGSTTEAFRYDPANPKFTGIPGDEYTLEFIIHPAITATIIIYDR